ncbi:MAG TPA: serine/threonine-protein kinase, partial [Bryobacteraceae bacterium]|nr:serine/threonine-protein kinase [Bryobacteraceae bacterium]
MTAEDWELIKRIFDGALSLEEGQWPEYIASAAGDREEIRETVLELLRNHQTCRSESAISHGRGTTPALPPGELVAGRFRIVRFIAGGGMGEVYEAFDEGLQVRLALKTLRAELAMNAEALTRFRREVILPRGISHSSVCRVYDFVEHRVPDANSPARERLVPCLSMELLEGESLARFIARERPLSAARALPIIRQIADGLSALHESGIIHRDLKPANIMLVPRSEGGVRPVVMDFGLAKIESSDNDIFETRNDFPAGAPYFMAPEILRNERPSVASDIYAFGLVIDEMVTRERAFPGESLQSLYFSRLWEDPISPRARAEGLPERWEATILRCLAREPSARFGSTQDVLAALDGNFTAPGQPVRSRRYLTRRRVLAAAVAAPVAFCAGFVAVALQPVQTSIEVFRIENLTGSPGWDYLAEGTTNELVRQLMQIGGLRVLQTRTAHSASHLKPKGRFLLDGVLRSEGEQIRLD